MNEGRLFQAFLWLLAVLFVVLALRPLRQGAPADAPSFYIAGHMAATGQAHRLYDPAATMQSWETLRASGLHREDFPHDNFFIRPAFAAFLYAPLALLPFDAAWKFLLALALLEVILIVWLFPKWFRKYGDMRPWRPLLLAYLPFVWAMGLSQDTVLLTLILGLAVHLVLENRQWPGGALAACLVVKPHLALALPLAFYFGGKRKAALSFAIVCAGLAALSFAAVGFHGVEQWRDLVVSARTDMFPYTMHNIRAVWIRFGFVPAAGLVGVVLVSAFLAFRHGEIETNLAVGMLASVLLSPHSYTQDLALLALLPFLTPSTIVRCAVFLPWMYIEPFRSNRNWPVIVLAAAYLVFLASKTAARSIPSGVVNLGRVAHERESG